MRLLCNGVALDLLSGAALSFKKSNPLFAFDALTCERTQSFDIPATPHNERVMQLAKLPAFRGEGMRRRFDAELQDGTVVKRGYLYVDAYNNGKYKAIFVTGELLELMKIKELGKIADIIFVGDNIEYGAEPITPTAALNVAWGNVRHLRKGGTIHPSILIRSIVERVIQQQGIRAISLPSTANGLRHIPAEVKALTNEGAKVETMAHPERYTTGATMDIVYDGYISAIRTGSGIEDYFRIATQVTVDYGLGIERPRRGYVVMNVPKSDIILTFPPTFPDNIFIVTSVDQGGAIFLGGYTFDILYPTGQIIRHGTPLAGREVQINADTPFQLVDERCRTVAVDEYYGWYFNRSLNIEIQMRSAREIASPGEIVRMQDNLPDITFVELLKSVAAMTDTVLNYTDASGITFETLSDMDEWSQVVLDGKVLTDGDLQRRFVDYAQHNFVRFDSGERVPTPIRIDYEIDNVNLQTERELQRISWSEGDVQYDQNGNALVYIAADDGEDDKNVIADSGVADNMLRARLKKNAGIQTLCDASTSVNIKVRMTLAQYERMSAKTAILCNGTRYVWKEATWSKEVATLKLSKIL